MTIEAEEPFFAMPENFVVKNCSRRENKTKFYLSTALEYVKIKKRQKTNERSTYVRRKKRV